MSAVWILYPASVIKRGVLGAKDEVRVKVESNRQ